MWQPEPSGHWPGGCDVELAGSNFTVPLDPFGLGSYASQDCVCGQKVLTAAVLGLTWTVPSTLVSSFILVQQIQFHTSALFGACKEITFFLIDLHVVWGGRVFLLGFSGSSALSLLFPDSDCSSFCLSSHMYGLCLNLFPN